MKTFEVEKVRRDFPILSEQVHGKPLHYFDHAATAQKPESVLVAMDRIYRKVNANVHRGVYFFSQETSAEYEAVRGKVAKFIGAKSDEEIIFTSGTTESINLFLYSVVEDMVNAGDVIVVTRMEHHANFVPWQQLAKRKRAEFRIVELTSDGQIDFASYEKALQGKPKVVALSHMSNVLGIVNPISKLATMAKNSGAFVCVDSAQAIAHFKVDVSELGPVDALAFSAHKIGGPTGVGVLWMREPLAKSAKPYQMGGDMIRSVNDQDTVFAETPFKFEAGTPNYVGVIGMGAAIDYLQEIGLDSIEKYEQGLTAQAIELLSSIPQLKWMGTASPQNRRAVLSFSLEGVHPHDLATFLDLEGIAVRAGHHCAQPLLRSFGVVAVTRVSLSFTNTVSEIQHLKKSLEKAVQYFSRAPKSTSTRGVSS